MRKRLFMLTLLATAMLGTQAQDITFADANVKALCVANWDTNGDGELSMDEAAAVTTLGTVFKNNKTIGTFEELKYFTGLTVINEYAFSGSSIGPMLTIPGTVKEVGDYAFNNCRSLTRIKVEEGCETIGWHTFAGPISYLSLPSTLTYMSSYALDPYVNADPNGGMFVPEGDLWLYVYRTTPAEVNDFAFFYIMYDGHLIVPMGCKEAYQNAYAWSKFKEYLELGDVNRDGSLDQTDVALIEDVVNGNVNKDIADINGDGVVNETDINLLKEYLGSTTAITETETATGTEDGATYNLAGQRVDSSYRGLVIRNGRKYVQR